MKISKTLAQEPLRLSYDLFTNLTRTPWAGAKISGQFKKNLPFIDKDIKVGESWELSCDPDMLTELIDYKIKLVEGIEVFPKEFLSSHQCEITQNKIELLVKVINPASPLSLQVHPKDNTPTLKEDECGKPECWYVLDAEKDAGIYLGFDKKLKKEQLKKILQDGNEASKSVYFVPVSRGDYFEIPPGFPHMIGKGVLILEPQKVLSSKKGKTYRMWDWGRKYNTEGREDPNGQSRELHLEESLALLSPEKDDGPSLLKKSQKKSTVLSFDSTKIVGYSFPENEFCKLHLIEFKEEAKLEFGLRNGYGYIICLVGEGIISSKIKKIRFYKGQSIFLPHDGYPFKIASNRKLKIAYIIPKGAEASFV